MMKQQINKQLNLEIMVKVTSNPKTGAIFTANAKPGKDGKIYGFIRLEENKVDLGGAIGSVKKVSILKNITAEAAACLVDGQEFPGQIISKDELAPRFEGHKHLQAPLTKGSSELKDVLSGGQKVYRTYEFTSDMSKTSTKMVYDKAPVVVNEAAAIN
jgi:hypothetical protein